MLPVPMSLWFLSSGFCGFLVLLLLSIFLVALCSDCNRRTFQLQDSTPEKNPSTLISVVKLQETRENPVIDRIREDEAEFRPDQVKQVPISTSRNQQDSSRECGSDDEVPVPVIAWRSHLVDPSNREGSSPPDSAHTHDDAMAEEQ